MRGERRGRRGRRGRREARGEETQGARGKGRQGREARARGERPERLERRARWLGRRLHHQCLVGFGARAGVGGRLVGLAPWPVGIGSITGDESQQCEPRSPQAIDSHMKGAFRSQIARPPRHSQQSVPSSCQLQRVPSKQTYTYISPLFVPIHGQVDGAKAGGERGGGAGGGHVGGRLVQHSLHARGSKHPTVLVT